MSFFDWNANGKTDIEDILLEYIIFKACTEDNNENDDDLFDPYDDFDDFD